MIQRKRYMDKITKLVDTPVAKVLTGMRRSGKSVLLELTRKLLLSRGIPESRILLLNLESMENTELKNHLVLYQKITAWISHSKERHYLLLDEIQEVEGWEKAINAFMVDFNIDLYLTGSNAHLLSSELATYISGRYIEIPVRPLVFSEHMTFRRELVNHSQLNKQEEFARYLRFGGLPGIHWMNEDTEVVNQYLKGVYSTVLLKDVLARNTVRDTALMEKIILYLMDNVGNLFSAGNVASFLKNQGRSVGVETIYNYMSMLENAFFLVKAPRFDIKGHKWLETNEKCYLADLGLRHAIIGYRDMDIGGLLENVVHQELLVRGYSVGIGKAGVKEIDFIATKGDETSYFQVCYLLAGAETIEREFSVLKAIPDNHPKTVLSMDRLLAPQRDGIKWKNLIDFLLEPITY